MEFDLRNLGLKLDGDVVFKLKCVGILCFRRVKGNVCGCWGYEVLDFYFKEGLIVNGV